MLEYGRYTPYILTAYGIAIVSLVALIAWSMWRVSHAKRKLERAEGKAPDFKTSGAEKTP